MKEEGAAEWDGPDSIVGLVDLKHARHSRLFVSLKVLEGSLSTDAKSVELGRIHWLSR